MISHQVSGVHIMQGDVKTEGDSPAWLRSGLEFLLHEAIRLELTAVASAIGRAIEILSGEIEAAGKSSRPQ